MGVLELLVVVVVTRGVSVTMRVLVVVGRGLVGVVVGVFVGVVVGVVVGVEELVGVPLGVPLGVPVGVETTRFSDGPPETGVQVYQAELFTLIEKPPPLTPTVPVTVGFTTTGKVGRGIGEPWEIVAAGVEVTPTLTAVEAIGVPLGLTVPSATIVLLGVICAVANRRLGVAVGCWMSQVSVTVALGVIWAAGVFSSIWNG
ncbi:hypothetical protein [Nonomuraea rhizosphaerae]|uniref:hypothetical protein n=1 Tax=Nonomuraea rhizosphaerae TaxID=2665663 RepID=UPI001C5F2677|nr:hypothetical protein [Nonomuraea rhizosphaerae]